MTAGGQQQEVIVKLVARFGHDCFFPGVSGNYPGCGSQPDSFLRIPVGLFGDKVLFLNVTADIVVKPYPVIKGQVLCGDDGNIPVVILLADIFSRCRAGNTVADYEISFDGFSSEKLFLSASRLSWEAFASVYLAE